MRWAGIVVSPKKRLKRMYQYTDFTKMFDPQNLTQNMAQTFTQTMSKMMDFTQAAQSSQSQMESYKKLSSIWADTYNQCTQQQAQMMQGAMEDTIEAMRDLSTCKGMEDMVSKQAEWSRKTAEKCQSNAQDLASTLQKGQTQCQDVISQMMQAGWNQQTTSKSSK
jgi:phasin family protein